VDFNTGNIAGFCLFGTCFWEFPYFETSPLREALSSTVIIPMRLNVLNRSGNSTDLGYNVFLNIIYYIPITGQQAKFAIQKTPRTGLHGACRRISDAIRSKHYPPSRRTSCIRRDKSLP